MKNIKESITNHYNSIKQIKIYRKIKFNENRKINKNQYNSVKMIQKNTKRLRAPSHLDSTCAKPVKLCMYMHRSTLVYIYIYMYVYMYVYIFVCIYVYVYVHIFMYAMHYSYSLLLIVHHYFLLLLFIIYYC